MAKPKRRGAKAYGWDRFIGILGMIFDVLIVALGSWAVQFGLVDTKIAHADQPKFIGFGALVIAMAAISFVINLGIFNSRRWAFIVAALFAGYGLSSGTLAPSGFMLLYTVLRLGKVFGPDLR